MPRGRSKDYHTQENTLLRTLNNEESQVCFTPSYHDPFFRTRGVQCFNDRRQLGLVAPAIQLHPLRYDHLRLGLGRRTDRRAQGRQGSQDIRNLSRAYGVIPLATGTKY